MKYLFLNWKQNTSLRDVSTFFDLFNFDLLEKLQGKVEVVIFPPFPYFSEVLALKAELMLGAQNVSAFDAGSYTGEVGASMLQDFSCKYCLVGHSERRQNFGESQSIIASKLLRLKATEVAPVLCIGESLIEREKGEYMKVLLGQVMPESVGSIVAYEPVWAIGTGKTPSLQQISEVAISISQTYGNEVIYGGSVNEKNISEIFFLPGVSGVLVGSASLKAEAVNAMLGVISEKI